MCINLFIIKETEISQRINQHTYIHTHIHT